MHALMLHNGEIHPVSDLSLSAGQVGLLSGWGVFSTIRVYDGVMFHWERHYARMKQDAKRMRVPFPEDAAALEADLNRLIVANGPADGSTLPNSTLRVLVVRNKGGLYEGPGPMPDFDVIAFTTEIYGWPESVRLGVIPNARYAASEFRGVKELSWAHNLTWYERAHEQGYDEVILLNEHGEVAECTSANIFVVKGDEVWTPPLESGCLPGVTRSVLLEDLKVDGIRFVERRITLEDLGAADEVCITSTTRELIAADYIEGLEITGGSETCERIVLALKSHIRNYIYSKK